MPPSRLEKSFFARDTIDVARELLGARLVHRLPDGTRLSGRIVETEAYLGIEDPSCHSFNGRRTPRVEAMYGEPGTSYIYFIYGVYFCFNVVTCAPGVPEAVLVRALEPLEGADLMHARRPHSARESLANGPGKLCIALGLNRAQNGLDLPTSDELWIERDVEVPDGSVVEGPRVGIGHVHDSVHWPLRFGVRDSAFLSPPKFPNYLK